jgi:hypothetical protein
MNLENAWLSGAIYRGGNCLKSYAQPFPQRLKTALKTVYLRCRR